uniref:Uncharacterized protein n=1 Tax=Glossina austeni TaxID=7395 RepID=A0A1A9VFQ8_GLOAU
MNSIAKNGVPCTGKPLYSTLIEWPPTVMGVNSAVKPACISPVTRTASIICVPTSVGTNSMRAAPFAASWVTLAFSLDLLGPKTVATHSPFARLCPGGGSISKTAGVLAGTRRVDSPNAVKPGVDMISTVKHTVKHCCAETDRHRDELMLTENGKSCNFKISSMEVKQE